MFFLIGVFHQDVFGIESLERIGVNSPRLVNPFGESVSNNVNINQNVQIAADIVNNQDKSQPFIYIVQVKNKDNVVMAITSIAGLALDPKQSLSPAISWSPQISGEYLVEIYVWKSMIEADALAKKTTLKIIAS